MKPPAVIAIDGPSGAGKSVLGESLARRLNYRYVDTGAMYRAVTYYALACQADLADAERVTHLAETAPIGIEPAHIHDGRQYTVLLDDQDVTWDIRQERVERGVSAVSAIPGVRRALVAQQRRLAALGRVVMVGRDITTVVLPNADVKIYLTASAQVRAHRRHRQLIEQGQTLPFEDVLHDIQRRDELDSGRADSPLRVAPDAAVIDSSGLSLDEVIATTMELVEEASQPCDEPSPSR